MKAIINIDVPDLEKAIAFYTSALELSLSRVIDGDVAEIVGAHLTIYLLVKQLNSVAVNSPLVLRNYERHWTPVHIDFVVDDLAKSEEKAVNAGAIKESDCVEWMGSRCISFSDPFGHGFCLIEFDNNTYKKKDTHV